MADSPTKVDRRRSRRHTVKDGSYVLLRQSGYTALGKIIDISRDGLSFRTEDETLEGFGMPLSLDILGQEESLNFQSISSANFLENICSIPVSHILLEASTTTEVPLKHRSSVRFGELSSNLASQLDCFIRNYSINNK